MGYPTHWTLAHRFQDVEEGGFDVGPVTVPHSCERRRHDCYPADTMEKAPRLYRLGKPALQIACMLGLPFGALMRQWTHRAARENFRRAHDFSADSPGSRYQALRSSARSPSNRQEHPPSPTPTEGLLPDDCPEATVRPAGTARSMSHKGPDRTTRGPRAASVPTNRHFSTARSEPESHAGSFAAGLRSAWMVRQREAGGLPRMGARRTRQSRGTDGDTGLGCAPMVA